MACYGGLGFRGLRFRRTSFRACLAAAWTLGCGSDSVLESWQHGLKGLCYGRLGIEVYNSLGFRVSSHLLQGLPGGGLDLGVRVRERLGELRHDGGQRS